MPGYGRYVGVSFTQDMTSEFFGTFLIPSIVHQDPHYHRMPNATVPRRIIYAIDQVAWTQGDDGKGMVNYADLVGFAFDDEIGNLYVPGQQTNLPASAERYAIDLATAPIDSFITEFAPDVARRIPFVSCWSSASSTGWPRLGTPAVEECHFSGRCSAARRSPGCKTCVSMKLQEQDWRLLAKNHSPPPNPRSGCDSAVRCTGIGLTAHTITLAMNL